MNRNRVIHGKDSAVVGRVSFFFFFPFLFFFFFFSLQKPKGRTMTLVWLLFLCVLMHCQGQEQVVFPCPAAPVNVSVPFVFSSATLRSALGVGPTASLTWGGGLTYRAISFAMSSNIANVTRIYCLFQRLSIEQQERLTIGQTYDFNLCSTDRNNLTVAVDRQIVTVTHSLNFGVGGMMPLPLGVFPGNVGGGTTFVVQGKAEVTIPAGEWTIAVFSDDGHFLELGSNVVFLSRVGVIEGTSPSSIGNHTAVSGNPSTATFTTTTPTTTTLSFTYFNYYGDRLFALAIASGHKTEIVASEFTVLSDNALGWRVRPNASQPLGERPLSIGCAGTGANLTTIAIHATNADNLTDPRSSSCVVSFRAVQPTLRCATNVSLALAARNGTELNATLLVEGGSISTCLAPSLAVKPTKLTCDDVDRGPVHVQLTALNQTCNATVTLIDHNEMCAPLPTLPQVSVTTTTTTTTTPPPPPTTTTPPPTTTTTTTIVNSTAVTGETPIVEDDDEVWWWWIIVLAAIFLCCILIVIVVGCVVQKRRRRAEDQCRQQPTTREDLFATIDPEPKTRGVEYASVADVPKKGEIVYEVLARDTPAPESTAVVYSTLA
jgi:hypothetical protein